MTRDSQRQLDLGPGGVTLQALRDRIAELEAELAALKRRLRARLGGLARAGKSRRRRIDDDEVWSVFIDEYAQGSRGAVRRTAILLGVVPKTIQRTLNRLESVHPELVRMRLMSDRRKATPEA